MWWILFFAFVSYLIYINKPAYKINRLNEKSAKLYNQLLSDEKDESLEYMRNNFILLAEHYKYETGEKQLEIYQDWFNYLQAKQRMDLVIKGYLEFSLTPYGKKLREKQD